MTELRVGDELELDVGPVAHGGHCVARHDNRVVFVRYALPGERVRVRLTDVSPSSFYRADAVEVLQPHEQRVPPPCAHFGPGGCGGCDFQHASGQLQRQLKAEVVAEQFERLAGLVVDVEVEQLPNPVGDNEYDDPGLGWRTRVRWGLDAAGRIGPRAQRSHDVVAVSSVAPCLIADPALSEAADLLEPPAGIRAAAPRRGRGRPGLPEVTLVAVPADADLADFEDSADFADSADIEYVEVLDTWHDAEGNAVDSDDEGFQRLVLEAVGERPFDVAVDGFWQAHRSAAPVLSNAVADLLADSGLPSGGRGWDLYGGVGVFAPIVLAALGDGGTVVSVEGDEVASALAASNLDDLPGVSVRTGLVEEVIGDLGPVDVVVLDPPRSGAGQVVCSAMADAGASVVVYVACDPAALARDTKTLIDAGYRLDVLRAFDCFPQTHHVECVARFVRA